MSPAIDEEDEVEEGQLETSPRGTGGAAGRGSESPVTTGPAAGSHSNPAPESVAKTRNRCRSRSRSHSRRRRSRSRSKRRRSGSRSRSPYAGPLIRDMRRGGGRGRGPRFSRIRQRPFRPRGRFASRSPTGSRSPSPRRSSRKSVSPGDRKADVDKNGRRDSSAEKSATTTAKRQLRPEDIKNQSKADTMSFLAMLHEKKQVNKMIPINLKSKSTAGFDDAEGLGANTKSHGFVSTFASLAGRNQSQAEDPVDEEDDGWEVVDDTSHSPNKRLTHESHPPAVTESEDQKSDSERKPPPKTTDSQAVRSKDKKKKKSKNSRRDESRKKKRKDKKRKHSDTESSQDSEPDRKKHRKRRVRSISPDAKSAGKTCKLSDATSHKEADDKKSKKREKKKSKHSRRSVSESESERISRKKSKKKKSKKSSQKKKKRKSSSPSSSSSESSVPEPESVTSESQNKTIREEEKACGKRSPDDKTSPTTFQFPRSVLLYTQTQPSIPFCRNPRTILLNPADDSPRAKQESAADPVTPSSAKSEHPSPGKRAPDSKPKTQSERDSSFVHRKEKGSPVERSSSSVKKKEEDDRHARKTSSSGSKHNPPNKKESNDRSFDSSHRDGSASPAVELSAKLKDSPDDSSVVDSVKQELLQKVAQKRKENAKPEAKDVKLLNDKIVIGKMKQSRKPGRREDKATPLDMNQDYSWYQQHYASSYAMDPYTAAYYAQYAMITSGDYSNPDISAWLQGYGFSYDPSNTAAMPLLPPTDSPAQDSLTQDSENQIPVLVKDVPPAAVEQFYQPSDEKTADTQPEEMDVDSDSECPTPPAPPPPPPPPRVTNLVVENAFLLPNGQEVPAGTKQVIVHPYPESHPLSSHFTPEFIQSSLNSLQSSKCEDKTARLQPNGASVVT